MTLLNLECTRPIPRNILNYFGKETIMNETLINIIDDICLSFKVIGKKGGYGTGFILRASQV